MENKHERNLIKTWNPFTSNDSCPFHLFLSKNLSFIPGNILGNMDKFNVDKLPIKGDFDSNGESNEMVSPWIY